MLLACAFCRARVLRLCPFLGHGVVVDLLHTVPHDVVQVIANLGKL